MKIEKSKLEIGDWRLEIGDWNWRLPPGGADQGNLQFTIYNLHFSIPSFQ